MDNNHDFICRESAKIHYSIFFIDIKYFAKYDFYMKKAVLITGVSGGMGVHIAKTFIDNGYFVYGLDIVEPKEKNDNLLFIKTNLKSEEEIIEAYKQVANSIEQLEAIINAAGIYDLNSLIEISEKDFINIFNINAFSCYRINKTFLPLLKEKGKIFMISSELGPLDPLPFTGLYGISKAVIEKYAYSLRMELQLLNYKVVVIRPGAVDTGLLDVSTKRINDFENNTTHYKYNAARFKKITNSVENRKVSPAKIGKLIYKVNLKKNPKYVYSINRNPGLILLNILPRRLQNYIIKKILIEKK